MSSRASTLRAPFELELDLELPLDSFTLAVHATVRARTIGVFGPSGAGKSSLLEAIAGLRAAARGKIRIGARTVLDAARTLPPEERGIGWVPQSGLLFPHLSVRENLLFAAKSADKSAPALAQVLELLEIGELSERGVAQLSGGEQRRVALGRALCAGPELLLLDEPFAGLDLALRRRLLTSLVRLRDELGVPMLLVSHDPSDVQVLCEELLVLERGRLIASGAPWTVLSGRAVFDLARRESFENVLVARVVDHGADTTRLRLGADGDGPLLIAPRWAIEPGERAMIGVRSGDVIVAASRPGPLSARNVVEATAEAILPMSSGILLHAVLGRDARLAVELTRAACDELQLSIGKSLFLIMKTHALRRVA
jgi:molybdate transport system ATP-binding protein